MTIKLNNVVKRQLRFCLFKHPVYRILLHVLVLAHCVQQLVVIHSKTNLPESKETTTLLVNLAPSTLNPLGTPLTLLTPCIQPTALANGVRIFREYAREVGGLLITT